MLRRQAEKVGNSDEKLCAEEEGQHAGDQHQVPVHQHQEERGLGRGGGEEVEVHDVQPGAEGERDIGEGGRL